MNLEALATRYEIENCPHLAAGIREALATGGRILTYRSLLPRGFQTDAIAIPADMHPADAWQETLAAIPDAYDRPAVYTGTLGPCSIHSATFNNPTR